LNNVFDLVDKIVARQQAAEMVWQWTKGFKLVDVDYLLMQTLGT
jgi:hypothetical protein